MAAAAKSKTKSGAPIRRASGKCKVERASCVTRALRLLQVFEPMEKRLGLSEIARRAGIPKSTAHRLLNIMAEARFIRTAEDGSYALGLLLWELGLRVISNLDLREIAHPVIEWLHHLVADAVHVAILDDCDVLDIDRLESTATIQSLRRFYRRLPANATASGKAILAYSEPHIVQRVLVRGLRKLTHKTIVNKEAFLEELRRTKERGYAVSVGETEVGLSSIAAPFFSVDGAPLGAISVVGPSAHIRPGRYEGLARLVLKAAERITRGELSVAYNIRPFSRDRRAPDPASSATDPRGSARTRSRTGTHS